MIYKQSEARLVRSIGVGLCASIGAYFGHAVYSNFTKSTSADLFSDPASISGMATLVVFIVAGFYFMFIHPKSSDFFIQVESESRKVTWPQWPEVKTKTGQTVVVMLALVAYLYAVDFILTLLRQNLL